ncbi:methyltransferase domain-containing protein [Alkalilacustris brevis]|uniref:methyltransferase domain-containing protein n=1 Tax=Alkalilacustris brevis TaxID=2026338 RepID=UPI000E0DFBBB|nr:methyltransferase domain-containing protein [Alkalilacustris brevis]
MSAAADWDPGAYGRFRGLRLRPALDLLAQVPAPAGEAVADLGCGSGAVGPVLRARFAGARLTGIDASAAMLERAAACGAYDRLEQGDIAGWRPEVPPALIFSNAALQWLGDHARLMPRLARHLPAGGVLAVQMPRNDAAPSHALLRSLARRMFPGRHPEQLFAAPVAPARDYVAMLTPQGTVNAWESEYVQRLAPLDGGGHPVRAFTESTMMRPFVAPLEPEEATAYVTAYEAELNEAYPRQADGSVLFPFRRVFFVLHKD